ncbi:MAG TPA: DUF4239 domain-containing protein [Candidatus Microsaccharimonas sp.]|jgi:small-conductance mechanosensitive channel
MGLIHFLILHLSFGALALAVIGVSIVIAILVALLCHIVLRKVHFGNDTNEEIRQLFTIGATLFSIILGFLIVVTWQKYQTVETIVVTEASVVESLYQQSGMLPSSAKSDFRIHLAAYTSAVIHDEWSKLGDGQKSQQVDTELNALWTSAGELKAGNDGEITISTSIAESLKTITEARQSRLYDSQVGLPWFFWMFIFIYALIIVVFFNMFKNRALRQRIGINAVLGLSLGIVFLFIMLIDYPFAGATGIKPAAFEQIQYLVKNESL